MAVTIKEISESYSFSMRTVRSGNFTISKYVRGRIKLRWNIDWPKRFDVIVFDNERNEIHREGRTMSAGGIISSTKSFSKYVGSYVPIEVKIIHFLDGRKRDICLHVILLDK